MNNMHNNTHKNSKREVVRKQTGWNTVVLLKNFFRNCVAIESGLINIYCRHQVSIL